ncbi:esterase [Mesorhizobium sp. 113-1-2]|uniref:alpha/beta hydrolase n=1 Tax=Mesorhizobium sp. 113-1-2 TaxID=2744515 RepID=UPI00081999C2|nr:alpha/beta hydrolase [Mesorhizobium sp. 113-1-2]BAV51146.1 carboxylesterase type B [Mesorhizobium loti]BCG75177.1 esterase [Mesorhizobium sp. 113-1-2]
MPRDPFRTRDHVADFDDIVADIVARSAATRATLPMVADVPYGEGKAERLDLFFPLGRRSDLPVHIFIHGGYWRMFSRSDYSYVAETVTKAGAIAVIVDYALMPEVRMAEIVEQVRRAKQWVLDNIAGHGGDPSRLSVSGHSAGAHLATFLFEKTPMPSRIHAALLLGGLYDLKPLQTSFLEPLIGITDEEAVAFTPMTRWHDPNTAATILVGDQETPPFHQQAADFATLLRAQGHGVRNLCLDGRNHMNSVRDLGLSGTQAADCLIAMIERNRH